MSTPTFIIKVTSLKNDITTNNVAQLSWTILGELQGQNINEQYSTDIFDGALGKAADLTEAAAVAWLEANDARLPHIKDHLQILLEHMVPNENLVTTTPSWVV